MLRIVKFGTRRRALVADGCDAVGLAAKWRAPVLERCDPAPVKVARPLPLPEGYSWKDGAKSVATTVAIGVVVLAGVLLLTVGW